MTRDFDVAFYEEYTLNKCHLCCGVRPQWGAFFIVCPKCRRQSDYDQPSGNAVRTWNKQFKEKP